MLPLFCITRECEQLPSYFDAGAKLISHKGCFSWYLFCLSEAKCPTVEQSSRWLCFRSKEECVSQANDCSNTICSLHFTIPFFLGLLSYPQLENLGQTGYFQAKQTEWHASVKTLIAISSKQGSISSHMRKVLKLPCLVSHHGEDLHERLHGSHTHAPPTSLMRTPC